MLGNRSNIGVASAILVVALCGCTQQAPVDLSASLKGDRAIEVPELLGPANPGVVGRWAGSHVVRDESEGRESHWHRKPYGLAGGFLLSQDGRLVKFHLLR